MHELSIVQSMLKLCEEYSKGKKVTKVVVKIGKMGGVEPHFLKESFELFKEDTVCEEASMQIIETDIKIECQKCKNISKVEGFDFYCPKCKGGDTKVISGQEMHIDYIEVKES